MKKKIPLIVLFSVLAFCASVLPACHNFYKASKTGTEKIDSLQAKNRFFILRNGTEALYMRDMVLSADRKSIECVLAELPPEHRLHLVNGHKGRLQYKKGEPNEFPVLSEVHIYIPYDKDVVQDTAFKLMLEKVEKIEMIEKDKGRTTGSYVIGAIGYTVGAFVVVGVIAAALKSSCPFVSADDGSGYVLQGEIFGGAIYPQLARHDYLPLKMASVEGSLQLKISNELQERQFTDMAELWVISHDRNEKIIPGTDGALYSVKDPVLPDAAVFCGKKNVRELLCRADQRLLYFDDSTSSDGNNSVELRFKKPAGAKTGKLVLNLKNSYWLDYLYGDLAKGFGKYYSTYTKKQYKKPASVLNAWTSAQQIPLEISVREGGGWKKIQELNTVGPLAFRDLAVPIDLSEVKDSTVDLRLSSGFMFWELEYTAMDFSTDDNIRVEKLQPYAAQDETGKDVLEQLTGEDNHFLAQPVPGMVATMKYHWQPSSDTSLHYSFILHTKGYYEHVRHFTGSANKSFLRQFQKPGAFASYSVQRYKQFSRENENAIVKSKIN